MKGIAIFAMVTSVCLLPFYTGASKAGEFEGGIGGCDLSSSISMCEWKPSGCSKPYPPSIIIIGNDVQSYNRAVDEFNAYLDEVQLYKDCIVREAKDDIANNVPDLIVKGARDLSDDVDRDVSSAKSNLDLHRPLGN